MATHEHTINVALGEVLRELRPHSWQVHFEETRTIRSSAKRPDVLIEEAAQWPVAIEADKANYDSAEQDAQNRLGQVVNETRKPIESVIALVYPPEVQEIDGSELRQTLRTTDGLEYALLTRTLGGGVERLPQSGWLTGSARDLAMLAHRASTPAPRVERMGVILEQSIEDAAAAFTYRHGSYAAGSIGSDIADLLGQSDDQGGQTRRMAMTVVINALIFHEALAEAEFFIDPPPPPHTHSVRGIPKQESWTPRRLWHLRELLPPGDFHIDALTLEWESVLEINYWPIFATASEIVGKLPEETAAAVLTPLRKGALRLVQRGVTKSHDLTGVIFQRLIADRKFLATFYTRPAAAALLAGLAIPADRAPGGAEWGDEDSIASLQIGDFACGTGTLLSAAYQRISLLHELHGGDPRELHAPMMKNGLVGLDVLNIAVHLTATMLAGAHPDVPFDGECLLTMPYGGESASIGSLELLAEHVQARMIQSASAITSGGRRPEDVVDLMTRVGHEQFDLIIMNPPFTRSVGQKGTSLGSGNPAFAAFETSKQVQRDMQEKLRGVAGKQSLGTGNAGIASHFGDLALRKVNNDGQVAFVLPLSAAVGHAWQALRRELLREFSDISVISIAQPGSFERSFSADTGIAEILLLAKRTPIPEKRVRFVSLFERPSSTMFGAVIADRINGQVSARRIDIGPVGGTPLTVGESLVGEMVDCSPNDLQFWNLVGVKDMSLAQCAFQLQQGTLALPSVALTNALKVDCTPIANLATAGPYHADIYWSDSQGAPRGPFEIAPIEDVTEATYPVLWAHAAKKERYLILEPDSQGRIKDWKDDQGSVDAKASAVWATATRAHYNRDLRFNAQSQILAMTKRKSIGGRAWPSLIFHDPEHEYGLSLWCNSTLGLLLHWWVSNKTDAGRGLTTLTGIPNIPTLDTRALTDDQHAEAKRQFELLSSDRFLPFDQIDEDPARAKLDRAILVDVLGLPESLVTDAGPIDLIRRKLAREPQIHGGKRSRVVFTENGEHSQPRTDRP